MTDPDMRRRSAASLSELRNQLPDDLRQQQNSRQIASRPTYTEVQLEEVYQIRLPDGEKQWHKKQIIKNRQTGPKEPRSPGAMVLGILTKIFPVIKIFITYNVKEYAVYDLLSGISVGLFIIPQAIAFSLLAKVKAQYGFYSAFYAMLIYFIFGTSKHLNMSSQGAVSLLVGEAVLAGVAQAYPNGEGICPETTTIAPDSTVSDMTTMMMTTSNNFADSNISDVTTLLMTTVNHTRTGPCVDRDEANTLVSISITMIAGAVQLLLGFLQFGFLTIYLSDPLNSAFTCGAALHILSSQLANMLGATFPPFDAPAGKFFLYFVEAGKQILNSNVHSPTILIFVMSFALLLAVKIINERCSKYVKIPIPIDVIVLVGSLLFSQFLEWEDNLQISVVGPIESGFRPPIAPPAHHFTSGTGIIINGLVLGIISYSLSVSVAKTFAVRHGYEVDSNQEMIAYGAVNFGMSWFSTFVSASSIACTSLHESMKGKTLLYSLYAVIITMIGILTFAPIFKPVPKCVLSAIILVNLKNMILQFNQLPVLWKTNRYDFAIWVVTLAAILGIDLPVGLLVGVIFSLATVIFRSQAPKAYLLGRVPETDIYKNVKKIKGVQEIEGVRVFKFDGSLYFASAENFRRRLFRQVAMNPKKILAKAKAHAKKTGASAGNLDIRTEVVDKEEIKEMLDIVKSEGSHPNAMARENAQASMEDLQQGNKAYQRAQPDRNYEDEDETDDDNEPTVNVFCIILDLSACAFTDAVGIRLLTQIVEDFKKIGVEIYLCGCTSLVRSQLRKGNFFDKRSEEAGLFITVHDAVIHALSTLYQEMVEDEDDEVPEADQVAFNTGAYSAEYETDQRSETRRSLHHSKKKKTSTVSDASDEEARELRRQARKISRQQQAMSANPDDFGSSTAASSSGAGSSRRMSQRATSEYTDQNGYPSGVPSQAKPLPVFDEAQDAGQTGKPSAGVTDVLVHEDEESRREREEMDLNFAEMLKSLPDTDENAGEDGHDNDGFEDSAL